MCLYLLDDGGSFSVCFIFTGLVAIILGLSFINVECTQNLPSVGFSIQTWLIVRGAMSCLFALIFLLSRRMSRDVTDCRCFQQILGVLASLFTLAWAVVIIFIIFLDNLKIVHENNCDVMYFISIFFILSGMMFELLFYIHLVFCRVARGSEYLNIYKTNDEEFGNPW